MNKITSIIFSEDRPAQLSLLLDSIIKNAENVFDINVLIFNPQEEFKESYQKLISKNKYSNVKFDFFENNLKEKVLDIIQNGNDYFNFFLDDNILYKTINLEDIISQIELHEDVLCFSLRLGKNVKKCYTLGGVDNVIQDIEDDGKFMKWDWSKYYLDFGFPFSIEGHVFRKKDIFKLTRKSLFNFPEELEISLFDFTESFPRKKIVSYVHSHLLGVPVARLQESLESEALVALKEAEYKVIRKEINNQFINDNFIKLEDIDFSDIFGCHQKIDLGVEFKKTK